MTSNLWEILRLAGQGGTGNACAGGCGAVIV